MFYIQVSNINLLVYVQIPNINLLRMLIFCDMSEEKVSRNISNGEKPVCGKKKNGDDFPIAFKFLSSETCRPQRPQRMGRKWAAHFCYVEALFEYKNHS